VKRNFKLTLEYDGSQYHGWQRQQGVLTLQEVLESRLGIIFGEPIRTRASGRTDAGVHARGQVINFTTHTSLQPAEIQRGLNSLLPPDIAVLRAEEVAPAFHARFSALSKIYEYRILNRPAPSALERHFVWHIRKPLKRSAMAECLESITGRHDFSAFMATGSSVTATEREIYRAVLEAPDEDHLTFRFEANGFLRHMVRNLVGTLVEVGKGRLNGAGFQAVLASGDRRLAGMTAPARGLYLVSVRHEESPGQ
jgi:tRNA pseudouridine38-40 synthase